MMSSKRVCIALSGLALVGVTFGMARYGYGLFLPQLTTAFSLDKPTQGLIGSGSYAGYLVATIMASWLSGHAGPRYPLALGALCAAAGTALVAAAASPAGLAIGIIVAGASPGLVFPALSDWASIEGGQAKRNQLFAIMNSGTGAGIILATPLAWLPLEQWRYAWWAFALSALIVGAAVVLTSPAGRDARAGNALGNDAFRTAMLIERRAWPLYAVSTTAGFVTAIYWTFSVETISQSAAGAFGLGRPELVFWMLTGLSGFLGALTGDAVNARGLGRVLRYTMLSIAFALALLGLFPGSLGAIVLSGIVFGAGFIFITGLLGVWSMSIFQNRPSAGFGVTFLLFTLGAMIGPSVSGLVATMIGQSLVFVLAGAIALLPCMAAPEEARRPAPV